MDGLITTGGDFTALDWISTTLGKNLQLKTPASDIQKRGPTKF
jgi:hypothetical protein